MPEEGPQSWRQQGSADRSPRRALRRLGCEVGIFFYSLSPVLMRTKSAAAQNNHERERALSLELAEKGAHELQESFESAVRGEDGGDDKEDNGGGNGNGNDSSDEDEDGEGDDDRGGNTAAMHVHAPGSSASITQSRLPRSG